MLSDAMTAINVSMIVSESVWPEYRTAIRYIPFSFVVLQAVRWSLIRLLALDCVRRGNSLLVVQLQWDGRTLSKR